MDEDAFQQHTNQMTEVWNDVAEGWHKWSDFVDDWTKDATIKMIDEAKIEEGSSVLEVAAGNGNQSLLVAEIVGPEGYVLSTDFSENMMNLTQKRADELGYSQIETKVMQVEKLEIEDQTFDAVICKFALMLFADREKAAKECFRVLKPGGKFSAIVFSTPQTNPMMSIAGKMIMESVGRPPPEPTDPGLFSLCQPDVAKELLEKAGFVDISIKIIHRKLDVSPDIDPINFLQEAAGELILMLSKLSEEEKINVLNNIRQAYSQFKNDDGAYSFPSESLVISGRKP